MIAAPSSIRAIAPFSKWNDHFIIVPPRRFVVFGEGSEGSLRGLAVDGYLNEDFDATLACSFRDLLKGFFKPAKTKYDPTRKVSFFDQLIGTHSIASFALGSAEIQALRKADARQFTHVRFYKKPDGVTTARVFNARKYFSRSISKREVSEYSELQLSAEADSDFHFYLELMVLKKLPIEDYELTLFDNEMITFEGLDSGHTFTMRDQRLGDKIEERIEDLGSHDEIFFLDPMRVEPTRNDWKSPTSQRR